MLVGQPTEDIAMEDSHELATEHYKWLETIIRKIYIDAFEHGYKHGKEDEDEESIC